MHDALEGEPPFLLCRQDAHGRAGGSLERLHQRGRTLVLPPRRRDERADLRRPPLPGRGVRTRPRSCGRSLDGHRPQRPRSRDLLAEPEVSAACVHLGEPAARGDVRDEEPRRVGADVDHPDTRVERMELILGPGPDGAPAGY